MLLVLLFAFACNGVLVASYDFEVYTYGSSLSLRLPRDADYLEFRYSGMSAGQKDPVVLWRRNDPTANGRGRGQVDGGSWIMKDLTEKDRGVYVFRRHDHSHISEKEIFVQDAEFPTTIYIGVAVLIVFTVVISCCCIKRCCCRKNPPVESTAAPTSAPTAVAYHQYDTEPGSPAYHQLRPPAPTRLAHPTSPSQPTPNLGPLSHHAASHSVHSPLVQPAPPPGSESLSLDSEPRFQLKGLDSLSPLSSETSHCDVYSSDKLNFL